ncbi:hypothetical protein DICVIV_02029 [Dictyocaulus viviparus]|uniref:Headcase middle domain-containing protein n=1 Tax=Dictyocaulus viviparus TaxID=29172 RepID=A0A0D8Y4Q3_DICVI|nr:hypothetical protein DICVIV_02029 [Dictyocaulus viviparus]
MSMLCLIICAVGKIVQADSDEFRRRSGSSRSDGKRWGRKDATGGELRCCIQPDVLRSNVDKHWFFEDEQVRVNGSVFARRENFDNLLSIIPMSKFNGIHIKMEDDCPQGGDDVRLCLLKTLGAHNPLFMIDTLLLMVCFSCHLFAISDHRLRLCMMGSATICNNYARAVCGQSGVAITAGEIAKEGCRFGAMTQCQDRSKIAVLRLRVVQCLAFKELWILVWIGSQSMKYLDPLVRNSLFKNAVIIYSLEDDKNGWFNGKSIVLGTLYYYDIVSAGKCCPPTCAVCRSPLLVPENIMMQIVNGNYSIMHELITCSACGLKNYHAIRRLEDLAIRRSMA